MTASQTATTIDAEVADPRAFLEMMGAPTAIFDGRGRVLDVNARLLEMTGRSLDEVVGGEPPHPWWTMAGWETGGIAQGESAISIVSGAGAKTPMRCVLAAIPWSASSLGRWIAILAPAFGARDPATNRHAGRVADLVERMARSLGWSPPRIAKLRRATLLHDVGRTPDTRLLGPGLPRDAEYERVRRHATLGANILAELIGPEQTSWVRHHHEHYDGRGYPDGLIGDHIPEGAALIAVADTFDGIVSGRPYATARSGDDALAEIRSLSGIQFSPRAVVGLERALATA